MNTAATTLPLCLSAKFILVLLEMNRLLDLLRQIRAKRMSRARARSVWGDVKRVDLYLVSFALNGLRFNALRVLADNNGDEIIIGRFVLNRLKVVLDGPAAMVEIVG